MQTIQFIDIDQINTEDDTKDGSVIFKTSKDNGLALKINDKVCIKGEYYKVQDIVYEIIDEEETFTFDTLVWLKKREFGISSLNS